MKKFIISTLFIMAAVIPMNAQPAPVKNAAKAVFSLTTFRADGSILESSHGVFIDNNGTAISDWASFVGADHAVVIDATGKKMDVEYLIGADEIYDVAKFHVNGKTTAATLATTPSAAASPIYLVGYAVRQPEIITAKVKSVETFMDKYPYYIMDMPVPDNTKSCPFVNEKGQVTGLYQQTKTYEIHATSAQYPADFTATGISANDPVLRLSSIPTAIADDLDQAIIGLMLTSQVSDSAKYARTVNHFISKFPNASEGYSSRAQFYVNHNDFEAADRDMQTCLQKAENKDDAHFTYARLMYQKEIYKKDIPYESWTLDRALEEAQKAYEINPLSVYKHLQAQIFFTKAEFQQAYDLLMSITDADMQKPEILYEAAQCKIMLQAPKEETLTLLDSAVACFSKPYTRDAAPYFLARANLRDQAGEYRKAIADYNQYDTLMVGRLGVDFFYQREQCEVKGRQFQQALNDIELCTQLEPREPLYYAEKASLQLRVNMKKEALATAEQCLALDPDNPDAYLIKGIAEVQLGNKKAGMASLNKAKELGHEQAQSIIDKYK